MSLLDCPLPLVVIVGPTAVGKSELAVDVAEQVGGEIISADSRLFYRGMDIGTAKPPVALMARVPHHLVDCADPRENFSLALFQQLATQAIQSVHQRGRLPLLVGGTGQYVRAVVEGWSPPVQAADPRLREILTAWGQEIGPKRLHDKLALLDSEAARAIDLRNMRRTIRALEVILSSGLQFSAQRNRRPSPYTLLQIGLSRSRQELYARIDARIDSMLANGFMLEVQRLLAQGCSPELPSMSAIGYREMCAVIRGEIDMDEAVMRMRRGTRQFVRRQANWFKPNDELIHWFDVSADTTPKIIELIKNTYCP